MAVCPSPLPCEWADRYVCLGGQGEGESICALRGDTTLVPRTKAQGAHGEAHLQLLL